MNKHSFMAAAVSGILLGSALTALADDSAPKDRKGKDKPAQGKGANDKHACKGQNACKGQGGCGESVAQNACKGTGECAVPLKGKTWEKARKTFEAVMKKAGKTVGAAPKP